MKKWYVIGLLLIGIMGFSSAIDTEQAELKTAISRSLVLLQSSSHVFLSNSGGCRSCHGQGLGGVSFSLAREKGFKVEDSILTEAMNSIHETWKIRLPSLAQHEDPVAIIIGAGYDLWAFSATGVKRNKLLELLAKNIWQRQRADGSWVSPNERPPLEYYAFSATALSLRAIQNYLPPIYHDKVNESVVNAAGWLESTAAVANEEKIFQLLGLHWANGNRQFIVAQGAKLLAAQHADGGWSQLDSLPTDAYATGQSLYALEQSGCITPDSPAYKKGVEFLLKTQLQDGSWRVRTRSFPSVDFVNSGFPHEKDQFISAAASNWATMALLLAVKP